MQETDLAMVRRWGLSVERLDGPASFQSPLLAQLYSWWREAGGGKPPPRQAFDIIDHTAIAPYLFLVRCEPDGRFVFRLQGEAVRDLIGKIDNAPVTAIFDNDYGQALEQYYRRIAADGHCRRCRGRLSGHGRGFQSFESIDCPLVDPSGRTAYLIGALVDIEAVD